MTYAEAAAYHLGNGFERHTLLGDRMIGAIDGAALQREPENTRRIEVSTGGGDSRYSDAKSL